MSDIPSETKTLHPPLAPLLVLIVAIVLPGVGQVLNNAPLRGLLMLGFMLILGILTYRVASPDVSVIGQFAGGLFIYCAMVLDAYYWARYRTEIFKGSKQIKTN